MPLLRRPSSCTTACRGSTNPDSSHCAEADNLVRLRLFVPYCQLIYALIDWFRASIICEGESQCVTFRDSHLIPATAITAPTAAPAASF